MGLFIELIKNRRLYKEDQDIFYVELDDKLTMEADRREFSDEIAIMYYAFTWLVVGLSYLVSETTFDIANEFYLKMDFIAIIYIALFGRLVPETNSKFLQFEGSEFMRKRFWLLKSTIISLIMFGVFIFLWSAIMKPPMIQGSIFDYLSIFFAARSVPVEEMGFRGLEIAFIYALMYRWMNLGEDGVDPKKRVIGNTIINIVASVVSGIHFGLVHITKYVKLGYAPFYPKYVDGVLFLMPIWYPIVYLCLLGILLGYIQRHYGLSCAIIVHVLNNFIAVGGVIVLEVF